MALEMMKLRSDLDQIAAATWSRVRLSQRLKVHFGETTVTDMNLMDLKAMHPDLKLLSYTQNDEARSGADWAWWWGSNYFGWIGIHVQAKISKPNRRGFPEFKELGHKAPSAAKPQIETLLASAATENAFAFHVFYNGWEYGHASYILGGGDHELFGCAALSTTAVRTLRNSKKKGVGINAAERFAQSWFPWSELFPDNDSDLGDGNNIGPMLDVLETRLATLSGESATAQSRRKRPMTLPDYVLEGMSNPSSLVELNKPGLPRFVLVTDFG